MANHPQLIKGGQHTDERGSLVYNNDFDLAKIKAKRCYCIAPTELRAWQGHQQEQKWFMAIEGLIKILVVQPDDWQDPSHNLKVEEYILKASEGDVLYVPGGYATGIKPIQEGSKIMVFSDFTLEESSKDDFRFDRSSWYFETFM